MKHYTYAKMMKRATTPKDIFITAPAEDLFRGATLNFSQMLSDEDRKKVHSPISSKELNDIMDNGLSGQKMNLNVPFSPYIAPMYREVISNPYSSSLRFAAAVNRPWLLPTAAGVAGAGLGYAALGLIPSVKKNKVLRALLSLGIGGATAGGAYYLDNVYMKA